MWHMAIASIPVRWLCAVFGAVRRSCGWQRCTIPSTLTRSSITMLC